LHFVPPSLQSSPGSARSKTSDQLM